MCLIPRLRSPSMIVATSGRTDACSSIAPPELVVDADHHHRMPFAVRFVQCGLDHFRVIAIPSISMNRLLPTRMVCPSTWTVMP